MRVALTDITWWSLMWALVGAFGTAATHENTGRDTRTGGLIGLAVGFVLGPAWLVWLWIFLAYYRSSNVIVRNRRWYEWWRW